MSHLGNNNVQAVYSGSSINHATTLDITITGDYFTNNSTEVLIDGQVVNSIVYVNSHEITVNLTTNSTDGFYDIHIISDFGSHTIVGGLEVELSVWLDLRLGGDTFTDGNGAGNDIRYRTGMSLTRDANGMYFSGLNPWQSWVKFESEQWVRGVNNTCQWIFNRPSSNMMIGIGSTATNEANNSQYTQAEVEVYFNNSSTMWGLYGNNGTVGGAGTQSNSNSIAGGTGFFKIKFEGDGGAGGQFTLYRINTGLPADWDDESQIITTFVIAGTLNPDEPNIMPFIIPRSGGTQRFIALKVS